MASDIVAVWLKKFVGEDYCEFIWGDYDFVNCKVNQNVGSVYGIWVKSTKNEIEEYQTKNDKSMSEFGGYLPFYWGKDVTPSSRLLTHFKTSDGSGGLDLVNSKYSNREFVFGCILTARYSIHEKRLHEEYPPKEGSSKGGKHTQIKNILK